MHTNKYDSSGHFFECARVRSTICAVGKEYNLIKGTIYKSWYLERTSPYYIINRMIECLRDDDDDDGDMTERFASEQKQNKCLVVDVDVGRTKFIYSYSTHTHTQESDTREHFNQSLGWVWMTYLRGYFRCAARLLHRTNKKTGC